MVENRCAPLSSALTPPLSSPRLLPRRISPSPFTIRRLAKLPPRYSSNFRSDEAARNCNDVFGRLTYKLGNLFIRVARCALATWEMYGIVGNLQTPRKRATSAACARQRGEIRIASRNGGGGVSHRRYKNTSSPANASIVAFRRGFVDIRG